VLYPLLYGQSCDRLPLPWVTYVASFLDVRLLCIVTSVTAFGSSALSVHLIVGGMVLSLSSRLPLTDTFRGTTLFEISSLIGV